MSQVRLFRTIKKTYLDLKFEFETTDPNNFVPLIHTFFDNEKNTNTN